MGRRIKQRREERGLQQAELARAVGKSVSMVGHWESGYVRISALELKSIARALSCPMAYLTGEIEHPLTGEDQDWLGHIGARVSLIPDKRWREVLKEDLRRRAADMERLFHEATDQAACR